jgi:hypothetical protein
VLLLPLPCLAVKPDGVQRGLVGEIIKRFEAKVCCYMLKAGSRLQDGLSSTCASCQTGCKHATCTHEPHAHVQAVHPVLVDVVEMYTSVPATPAPPMILFSM